MKIPLPTILAGITVLLTLILGCGIYQDYSWTAFERGIARQQEISRQQVAWALEDQKLALTAQGRAQGLDVDFSNRLVQAWGGRMLAALKNPKWSIAEMLQQTAAACAPPGTRVTVSVDRFTDFDVALELPDGVSHDQISDFGRVFITNTQPYIHRVRLFEAGQSVGHWEGSPDEGVAAREIRSDAPNAAALATAVDDAKVDSAGMGETDPNYKKYLTAQEKFNEQLGEHTRQLNQLARDLDSIASLKSIATAYKFRAEISWLDRLSIQLTNEQAFFLNQDGYWEQLMQEQQLEPLLIRILKRDMAERTEASLPLYNDVFLALVAYHEQIGHFLRAMDSCRDQWRLMEQSNRIQFSTSDANSTYNLEFGMVQSAVASLNEAMQRLSRFRPPQPASTQ